MCRKRVFELARVQRLPHEVIARDVLLQKSVHVGADSWWLSARCCEEEKEEGRRRGGVRIRHWQLTSGMGSGSTRVSLHDLVCVCATLCCLAACLADLLVLLADWYLFFFVFSLACHFSYCMVATLGCALVLAFLLRCVCVLPSLLLLNYCLACSQHCLRAALLAYYLACWIVTLPLD